MLKVIIYKGLPGSGKSTHAKSLIDVQRNSYKRISKDDLRAMLDNSHWSGDAEKFILKVRDQLILMALEKGKHVIVDDTNLHPKHEVQIRELVAGKAEVVIEDFTDVDVKECIRRDLIRPNSVGQGVILDMYNKFLKDKIEKIPTPALVQDAPWVVICDLDGTLALLNGRNPYDASTCINDGLNPVVAGIIKDKHVIIVSGREDKYADQTVNWLEKHDIRWLKMVMRKTGDNRKDSIVKREIYETAILGKFNVSFVLDDRSSVVTLWRSMGLTCLQVAEGDF